MSDITEEQWDTYQREMAEKAHREAEESARLDAEAEAAWSSEYVNIFGIVCDR